MYALSASSLAAANRKEEGNKEVSCLCSTGTKTYVRGKSFFLSCDFLSIHADKKELSN